MRFTLVTGNSPGNDARYSDEKVAASRNFANKIWNAARFIHMNIDGHDVPCALPEALSLEDQWIVSRFNHPWPTEVTENLGQVRAGHGCVPSCTTSSGTTSATGTSSWPKRPLSGEDQAVAQNTRQVLVWVLTHTLALLHPFMPFVTEEIWQSLPHDGEALIVAPWPQYEEGRAFPQAEAEIEEGHGAHHRCAHPAAAR